MNSFYILESTEQAVVQRLGQHVATINNPGINFKIPIVDKVFIVNTNKTRSIQYGYRPENVPTSESAPTYVNREEEQIVLTKGSFLVNAGAIIQYKITDAPAFIYNVDDQYGTIRLVFESVLRRNMQNKNLDSALIDKTSIASEILPDLKKKINEYGLGITITEVQFTDITLPDSVQIAYDEVNIAKNEKDQFKSKAAKYTNEKLPNARANAYKLIQEAEGYEANKVAQATGDVQNFIQVYEKYKSAKEITKKRLYIETMEKILSRVNNKYIIDFENGDSTIKYLPLNPGSINNQGGNQ